jgi:hypothetical protein
MTKPANNFNFFRDASKGEKMKAIYEFYWDCGRMGDLEGLFVARKQDVDAAVGKEIYFGEVLGKHSEIYGTLEEKDLKIKTEDQDFIAKFEQVIGTGTISGLNPLDYCEDRM